jgi:dihydrofolate reductase
MRKIIAALRVSVDGFIQGPKGENDWVDTWADLFDLLSQVDTCIVGRGMYPFHKQYWEAILANPKGASKGEIAFARFTERTPHVVLSKTLRKVTWENTRIVRDLKEIARMKRQSGKDIYAVGGATLVGSLMNQGLIDELRLLVYPIVLGGGKALFKDVNERHALKLVGAKPLKSGLVRLTYSM